MNDMQLQKLQDLSQFRDKLAIFYDTETTGLPGGRLTPLEDQPHIVQLAWQLVRIPFKHDKLFRVVAEFQSILSLLDGGRITEGAYNTHGISDKMCAEWGLDPVSALDLFFDVVSMSDLIVAHNEKFDRKLVGYAFERLSPKPRMGRAAFDTLPVACTQELSRDVVKLPATPRMKATGRFGHKTPKLTEAYEALVGGKLTGAHDAMVDVRGTVSVFEALIDQDEAPGGTFDDELKGAP